MKTILTIIFLMFIACSCNTFSTPADEFNKLTPPIILAGESIYGDVTVCDANNKYVTICYEYYIARTISTTYDKGDTILFNVTK